MLTLREARQRVEQANMAISRVGATVDFRVTFNEDSGKDLLANAYITDDIEDAYLTALSMRRKRSGVEDRPSKRFDVV